jgi:hypothetical protein
MRKKSKQEDQFDLDYALASRDEDLRQKLLDFNPDILHFSGHGGLDGLYFLDDTSKAHKIRKEALVSLFALYSNQIRCVVLNACYSKEQAQAISQHIDVVIGMNNGISDEAAIKYATVFYQALFSGKEIEFAHKFACNAIHAADFPDYQTPVIFRRQPVQSEQASKTYLSGYQIDVLIHAASTEKAWAETFVNDLKKHIAQELHGLDKFNISLEATGETDFSHAATIILLLSPNYINEYQSIFNQFTQAITEKRLFLGEYSLVSTRPESLRGLSKFCFWHLDEQQDIHTFSATDSKYFVGIGELANSIVNRLHELEKEQVYQEQLIEKFPNVDSCGFIFVDASKEDKDLIDEAVRHLNSHGIDCMFPLNDEYSSDFRQVLDKNLKDCDALLILYRNASNSWLSSQISEYLKIKPKRETKLKIIALALHKDAVFNAGITDNLKVFHCPPEKISDYISNFVEALK